MSACILQIRNIHRQNNTKKCHEFVPVSWYKCQARETLPQAINKCCFHDIDFVAMFNQTADISPHSAVYNAYCLVLLTSLLLPHMHLGKHD